MAGYADTRQMIIDTLVGRLAGTEIQPEDHQAFALQITDYIRSVELVAGSATPIDFAEADTVPVQPDNGQAVYLSQVMQNSSVTFSHFLNQEGDPITIESDKDSITFVVLLWNGQYWTASATALSVSFLSKDTFKITFTETDEGITASAYVNEIREAIADNKYVYGIYRKKNSSMYNLLPLVEYTATVPGYATFQYQRESDIIKLAVSETSVSEEDMSVIITDSQSISPVEQTQVKKNIQSFNNPYVDVENSIITTNRYNLSDFVIKAWIKNPGVYKYAIRAINNSNDASSLTICTYTGDVLTATLTPVIEDWKCESNVENVKSVTIEGTNVEIHLWVNWSGIKGMIPFKDVILTLSDLCTASESEVLISSGGISSDKIAPSAITNEKIDRWAVKASKIANDAIITDKIINKAVTTQKIADKAVTEEKLSDDVNTKLDKIQKLESDITDIDQDIVNLQQDIQGINLPSISWPANEGDEIKEWTVDTFNTALSLYDSDKLVWVEINGFQCSIMGRMGSTNYTTLMFSNSYLGGSADAPSAGFFEAYIKLDKKTSKVVASFKNEFYTKLLTVTLPTIETLPEDFEGLISEWTKKDFNTCKNGFKNTPKVYHQVFIEGKLYTPIWVSDDETDDNDIKLACIEATTDNLITTTQVHIRLDDHNDVVFIDKTSHTGAGCITEVIDMGDNILVGFDGDAATFEDAYGVSPNILFYTEGTLTVRAYWFDSNLISLTAVSCIVTDTHRETIFSNGDKVVSVHHGFDPDDQITITSQSILTQGQAPTTAQFNALSTQVGNIDTVLTQIMGE